MKTNAMQRIARATLAGLYAALMTVCQPVAAANPALDEAVNAVDECVSKLDKTVLSKPVAQALKMEQSFVEKALVEAGCSVSDIVFIRALAVKTGQTPAQILERHLKQEWVSVLKQAGISEAEMAQIMDDAYADLALKMLEFPRKKDNKRTAKN